MNGPKQKKCQLQRIASWGESYLESTRESYRRTKKFSLKGDYFTAYLYMFIGFNNLYSLLARCVKRETCKIRAAVEMLSDEQIESLYTDEYFRLACQLNDRIPEQFKCGPDVGSTLPGVVNMQKYFSGKASADCIAHINEVTPVDATIQEKRCTLQKLAACLLYTTRNNQFHALKGPHNLADKTTLEWAYKLLEPLVSALILVGKHKIEVAKKARICDSRR
jgi:hypothetical protein